MLERNRGTKTYKLSIENFNSKFVNYHPFLVNLSLPQCGTYVREVSFKFHTHAIQFPSFFNKILKKSSKNCYVAQSGAFLSFSFKEYLDSIPDIIQKGYKMTMQF